jgi:UDP-GlcNAc:undecaprenyl-phosphate GlcNAc-1-phosphate transferase
LVWLARLIGIRSGLIAQPRNDRWHHQPTPVLGGVGIFAAACFTVSFTFISNGMLDVNWTLMAAPALMFMLGLVDDIHPLSPSVKLFGQITAAVLVIFVGGFYIRFFPWTAANVLLTLIWLVGITNAMNLLDNMDGLAGGIAFIAAVLMSFLAYRNGDQGLLTISLALAGSVLAFLCFNFPPARIFMGDSGSMFIGFTLAELAVARRTTASNVLAVLAVPVLVFLLPILDTTLVTVTRVLRGRSPVKGGRDHASHRLVSSGLSERQTIMILYGISILSGAAGMGLEALDYGLSLALIPALLVALAFFAVYLGKLRID